VGVVVVGGGAGEGGRTRDGRLKGAVRGEMSGAARCVSWREGGAGERGCSLCEWGRYGFIEEAFVAKV